MKRLLILGLALLVTFTVSRPALGESQGSDYKGVTDPFGDPANYEFAEDEKEDKEFFHLGRYLMLGVDIGVAIFTGGLGKTVQPGAYFGARLLYFFDKAICLEAAGHFSNHLDEINPDGASSLSIDTNVIPLTIGFRYYFDTKNAPKAIAIANPYLSFGGGIYMRQQSIFGDIPTTFRVEESDTTTSNFGGYGGAGVEFSIYRRHIYLGVDIRYHLIFFSDETADFGFPGVVERNGDYLTSNLTLSYNF